MLARIPFKRTVRHLNRCLTITIPKHLALLANVKPGEELDFTVVLNLPEDPNKEKPIITPVKA